MLEALSDHIPEVTAVASVILAALLGRWLHMKAKLQYSVGHASSLLVEEPLFDKDGNKLRDVQIVHSASIFLKNAGLLPASAAEVTFNWKPPIFNVAPARAFTTQTYALNRYAIHFDSLAPGEQVTIHIMSINQDLPVMTAVRAENSVGAEIRMTPMRVWPTWFNAFVLLLLLVGVGTLIYWAAAATERLTEVASSPHVASGAANNAPGATTPPLRLRHPARALEGALWAC